MHRLRIQDAVLVLIRQSSLVPLLHKDEEQRRQHGGRLRADAALVALLQGWRDHRRNFREAVGGDALVGVLDIGVGKALKHHIPVGRQINAVIAETRYNVLRNVAVGNGVDNIGQRAFMNILLAD